MVITRNGCVVHPCIKEAMPSVTHTSRSMSRRIAELPSLRYGSVGARTTTSGPLRVTNHYHCDTIPKVSTKKSNLQSLNPDDISFKPLRPARRVRFTLPPGDGDTVAAAATGVSVAKPTAGPENGWLRTRGFSQRSVAQRTLSNNNNNNNNISNISTCTNNNNNNNQNSGTNFHRTYAEIRRDLQQQSSVVVSVTASPGARSRVHPTGRYIRGTLSPTANTTAPTAPPTTPGGQVLIRAARDGEDSLLRDIFRRAVIVGIPEADLNATDTSGRTVLSYVASNGPVDVLEQILLLSGLDPNRPDNEGNTPLHFAAQAGQVECLNCILTRCRGIEIDARNNLGFTPLMKAALQGRNKCAKLLLFAGSNPTLRDNGRGLRADQWARFCGRYVCADVIEKHARQRLLERSTSYGNWGGENDVGARMIMGKVVPVPQIASTQQSNGLKSKLRKVFRTSSGPGHNNDNISSARLVTQLTSAALCASTPVLPTAPTVPPVVKSLIRPLTVPRLQITLVSNGEGTNLTNGHSKSQTNVNETDKPPVIKPARTKKKK
ncbi:PREDICTED: uncharacterized protein LOC108559074 isoform X2 [Nicrophorus vespilloides]|uniref:Uncharacterized protein LOC108559074 isoform X2 n=1 Tax=Nicrophorus vespilloides TaxID=110193 RepID=A0ABM1MAV0_NICVS|nr:PREDICTED: uncharacterized protein LOC108559074 isoform X2 [Nicrophorus vespilloides]